MENNKISFWSYLNQNKVMIPIIQRDYAQGRPEKGALRKNFLESLKQALDGTLPNDQNELKLDFVYGSVEKGVMLPLDGQQRLTTLWLLHWYIALKSGKLSEAKSTLIKFTYETRRSSREFCQQLARAENFASFKDGDKLYDFIITRTWFASSWLNDPTITSMLRMISGTVIDLEKVNKKALQEATEANNQIDGLEKLFKNTSKEEFERYWQSLTSSTPPIYFYQLPLQEYGLSDDLYVKMNARGKQLTAFENFKADLIGYIRQRAKEQADNSAPKKPDADKDWISLLDPRAGIPIKLDADWANIFWKHRSEKNLFDEIFFAFLNRVFWEEFVMSRRPDTTIENDDTESTSKAIAANNSYNYLITDNIQDYHDLAPYRFYKDEIPYSLFVNLSVILDKLMTIGQLVNLPRDIGETFHFIPQYIKNQNNDEITITRLTQPHRVIFHAIYKYLLEGNMDTESLGRWLRVVCNITSGKSSGKEWHRYIIRTDGQMLAAIDIVSKLNSHKVYESLKETSIVTTDKELPNRLNEEIVKAKQILDEHNALRPYPTSEYISWEEAISTAENYSFFNGSICFLYQNSEGNVEWNDFNSKFLKIKEYFLPKTRKDDSKVLNENYAFDARLLRSLISRFSGDQFWNSIWWAAHYIFDNTEKSWRHYLYSTALYKPIHEFLTEDADIKSRSDVSDRALHMLYLLSNTGLLEYSLEKFGNSYIRTYHGHDAIYPSSTGVFLDTPHRDDFLNRNDVNLVDGEKVPNSPLIYGTNINFIFAGHTYQWNKDGAIYLMKPDFSDYMTIETEGNVSKISTNSFNKDSFVPKSNEQMAQDITALFDIYQNLKAELEVNDDN
ncbi:MAG: DUF262 domain-containing protein [Muribaculaceae bacterium]|nr:DUF262 domain-containing protein [Muribaculaceae bacterium]